MANKDNIYIAHSYGGNGQFAAIQKYTSHGQAGDGNYEILLRCTDEEKKQKMYEWIVKCCNNKNVKYSTFPNTKRAEIFNNCMNYKANVIYESDCSAFMSAGASYAGTGVKLSTTAYMKENFTATGYFKAYSTSTETWEKWKPGDILVSASDHTVMIYKDANGEKLSTGVKPKKNYEKAFAFFQHKGLCQKACCAMVAHLMQECGDNGDFNSDLNTGCNENGGGDYYTTLANNGCSESEFYKANTGYGILQWTGIRRKEFFRYWKNNYGPTMKSIADLNVQLEYLWKELESGAHCTNGFSLTKLKNYTDNKDSLLQILADIHDGFVRSNDRNAGIYYERENTAKELWKRYEKTRFSYTGTETTSGTGGINDYLFLMGQEWLKYNTVGTIKQCYLKNNPAYKNKFPLKAKKIIISTINQNNDAYLNNLIWPSEDETEEEYLKLISLLGTYKNTHWNYDSKHCKAPHIIIGKTAVGQVTALNTLPFYLQSNYITKNNANSQYLQIVMLQDMYDKEYWTGSTANQELIEIIMHLCCYFQINPETEGNIIFESELDASVSQDTKNLCETVKKIITGEQKHTPSNKELKSSAIAEMLSMSYEDFKKFLNDFLYGQSQAQTHPYSKKELYWLELNNLIQGKTNEAFDEEYGRYITKEEFVQLINKAIDLYKNYKIERRVAK